MNLEIEQKHFLSLAFFGIGKCFAKNGYRFPKSWEKITRILLEHLENPQSFFEFTLKDLQQDPKYSELMEMLLNDFKNVLLSQRSQKGILLLLYILKTALEESSSLIPEENSGKLIDDIMTYLRSH